MMYDYSLYSSAYPPVTSPRNPFFSWGQKTSAVEADNLDYFKQLCRSDPDLCGTNALGNTFLHCSIISRSTRIFEYILSQWQTCPLNKPNFKKQTPLMLSLLKNTPEHFALKLIEAGADIYPEDKNGNTALHLALFGNHNRAADILIEHNADIDALNHRGESPAFLACEFGTVNHVAALVYYGADLSTVSWRGSLLPLEAAMRRGNTEDEAEKKVAFEIQEILFPIIFDGSLDFETDLITLLFAYESETPLLDEFVYNLDAICYKSFDIRHFLYDFLCMKPTSLVNFHKKFNFVMQDILAACTMLDTHLYSHLIKKFKQNFLTNLDFLLSTDLKFLVFEFVGNINIVFKKLLKWSMPENLVHDILLLLVTYGMPVYEAELYETFTRLGDCRLFKTLCYVDLIPGFDQSCRNYFPLPGLEEKYFSKDDYSGCIHARLVCDPSFTIGDFFEDPTSFDTDSLTYTLDYYAGSQLKMYCKDTVTRDCTVQEKALLLPNVPCLRELARNKVRERVGASADIKNTKDMFYAFQRLNIGKLNIKILTFETKLYENV